MVVKLKVMHGPSAGKEIKIPKALFVIGRADECHLRPKSDAISRRHCEIEIKESQAVVRDAGSKNGTFVNGDKVVGDRVLKSGDHLKVGPLEFEVVLEVGITGEKRPKVQDVKDAALRTSDSSVIDSDISSWLEDEIHRPKQPAKQPGVDSDTRQFKLEETDRMALAGTNETDEKSKTSTGEATVNESLDSLKKKFEKREVAKLPPRQDATTATSRDAAADALKKFFNRR